MDVYVTQVKLYTSDDIFLYLVFLTLWKGAALSWFTHLLLYSIDYFDTLVMKFGMQFATSRSHHLTSIALVNI